MKCSSLLPLLLVMGCGGAAGNTSTKSATLDSAIAELEAAPGETDDDRLEGRYDAAKQMHLDCRKAGDPDPTPCQMRVQAALDAYILRSARARPDPNDAYWSVKFALLSTTPSPAAIALARELSAARAQKRQEAFDKSGSYKSGHNCVFSSAPFSEKGEKNPALTYSFATKQAKVFYQCHSDVEFKNLVGRMGKLVLALREIRTGTTREIELGPPDRVPGSVVRGEIPLEFSIPSLNATSMYMMLNYDSVVGQEVDPDSTTPAVRDKWESKELAGSAFFWDPNGT